MTQQNDILRDTPFDIVRGGMETKNRPVMEGVYEKKSLMWVKALINKKFGEGEFSFQPAYGLNWNSSYSIFPRWIEAFSGCCPAIGEHVF